MLRRGLVILRMPDPGRVNQVEKPGLFISQAPLSDSRSLRPTGFRFVVPLPQAPKSCCARVTATVVTLRLY